MDRDERLKGAQAMKRQVLLVVEAASAGNALAGGPYSNVINTIRQGIEMLDPSGIVSSGMIREDAERRGVNSPI